MTPNLLPEIKTHIFNLTVVPVMLCDCKSLNTILSEELKWHITHREINRGRHFRLHIIATEGEYRRRGIKDIIREMHDFNKKADSHVTSVRGNCIASDGIKNWTYVLKASLLKS